MKSLASEQADWIAPKGTIRSATPTAEPTESPLEMPETKNVWCALHVLPDKTDGGIEKLSRVRHEGHSKSRSSLSVE